MTQPGTQVPRIPCPPCVPQPAPPDLTPAALTADDQANVQTAPETSTDMNR